MAFLEYYSRVDRRGRVTMPLPYRQAVGDKAMLLLGPQERCITGSPSKVAEHSLNDELRGILTAANIFERHLDSRGRITIPANLREHAEIEAAVVIVADDEYFELWNERNWEFEVRQAKLKLEA